MNTIEYLRDDNAQLRAIIERLQAEISTRDGILRAERAEKYEVELQLARETARADSAVKAQAELMRRNDVLRQALRDYGCHAVECICYGPDPGDSVDCECGLAEFLE